MKTSSDLAKELKSSTTAVSVNFNWFGMRKSLDHIQRAKAANAFGADKNYLSATQKLLNTKHPALARLTTIKNTIVDFWRCSTLPYTEEGVRLLHKDKVNDFNERMTEYRHAFFEAVDQLDTVVHEIKDEAKHRLGSLYDDKHYPDSFQGHFNVEWSFPSIEPPEYLATLAPKLYAQEQEKIQAKLAEAVELAEGAFINEFKQLLDTLHERLKPEADGKKKVFRDSTVTNLTEFFKRFKELNIGGNDDLDKLIHEAQDLVKGVDPQELRDHNLLRQEIQKGLDDIGKKLSPLVVNAPRRKIVRPNQESEKQHDPQNQSAA